MILGRGAEVEALAALLEGARAGRGAALVVRGEAGIGKSALLEDLAGRAGRRGVRVLATAGVQAEVHIPYASLHRLLRTAPDLAGTAGSVLGSPDTLPFRAATALLDAIAATRGTVLITVEDLQWLDDASWDALAFAARRLGPEHAAMLITARDGADVDRRLSGAGLSRLRLEPLGRDDSRALLGRVAPGLTGSLADQVLEAAAGNALGLVELGEAAARTGAAALTADRLPLSERLERTFSGLVAELPAVTRTLLLVAALDDGDDLGEIVRAGAALTEEAPRHEDVDPAVATRLVQVDDRFRVRFRHPLLRSALYQSASPAERRRIHAALAAVLADDPDRTVWHRAAAAAGPDEELARLLTETATRARHRQAPGIAVTALERAARLSEDAVARGHRLLAAVEMASEQGNTVSQARLLAEIRTHELSAGDRALHEYLVETHHGTRWSGSERILGFATTLETLVAAGESTQAIRLLDTFTLRAHHSDLDPAVRARLIEVIARMPADDPLVPPAMALVAPIERGAEARRRMLAFRAAGALDPYATYALALGATAIGDCPAASDFHAVATHGLRQQGRIGVLYRSLISHAMNAGHLGDARTALALIPEGEALAREIGEPNWLPAAWTAAGTAEALRGDPAAAEKRAADAEAVLLPYGRNTLLAGVRQVRGIAALAAGRPDEAYRELSRVFDRADDGYHLYTGFMLVAFLAEAAAGCGATGGLRRLVTALTPVADQSRSPALTAGLGYARAVLADTAEGWQAALADDLTGWPFEQARRQHAYGAWLRRRRRPAESRPLLRAAAATFDALGATAWAERSRSELRASGESLRKPQEAGLTPQETQIARLAAEGLSNREIADRLFLSPRTVTTHLSRIYPKLGIRSRAELGRALPNT
ncbi:ATP-binding protein [Catenuloplanes japonicus]|uniref:ATP-binding protein n=1 Tax=Catenuloplanes japonicus TaxID=33876 RepID=UPI000526DD45|nr:LuxR family transcriptional regulator [Catenuloplanes japonicus]